LWSRLTGVLLDISDTINRKRDSVLLLILRPCRFLVLKLSAHDEDWYVETPANSALKAMANTVPDVLDVSFERLDTKDPEARLHAASALRDIARQEPALLDPKRLQEKALAARRSQEKETLSYLEEALHRARRSKRQHRYRYGF
jgi:hypothetical protein